MLDPLILLALGAVGMLAGFVDAIAGGGGMIALPALLSAGLPPVAALATNKLQSVFGTAMAALTYWRRGFVSLKALVPAIVEQVTEVHPYDVPCVLALPLVDGAPDYLAWVRAETQPTSTPRGETG